jgi:hypothetical protein
MSTCGAKKKLREEEASISLCNCLDKHTRCQEGTERGRGTYLAVMCPDEHTRCQEGTERGRGTYLAVMCLDKHSGDKKELKEEEASISL